MPLRLLQITVLMLFAPLLAVSAEPMPQRLAYGYPNYWQAPMAQHTSYQRYPAYGYYGQPQWHYIPSTPRVIKKPATTQGSVESSKAPATKKSSPKKVVNSSVAARKKAFFDKVVPLIHRANKEILDERERMLPLLTYIDEGKTLSAEDQVWLKALAKRYRVKKDPLTDSSARAALRIKVDMVPVDLAVAQAANESGWGESRFAKEANNLFGVWTYDKSKGLAPLARDEGLTHMIRKYDTLQASIQHYLNLLNSHPAYIEMRSMRTEMRNGGRELDGYRLAEGLVNYSSKGEEYVKIIQAMISGNRLKRFRALERGTS